MKEREEKEEGEEEEEEKERFCFDAMDGWLFFLV